MAPSEPLALTGREKTYLRGLAHPLNPVVFVGSAGATASVIAELSARLDEQELLKVRFVDRKDEKKELAAILATGSRATLIGLIGHVAIFYRQHKDPAKRLVDVSKAHK